MKFLSLPCCALLWLASASGPLTDGLILERELRGGETHGYPVALETGEFLRIVVDQDGIDVVVRLLDPDGVEILAVDSPNGRHGDEDLAALAAQSGPHQVEVVSSPNVPPGRYRMKVMGPRQPDDADRLRVEAVRVTQEALHAEMRRATTLFERALDLWHSLGDRRRQADSLYVLGELRFELGEHECAAEHGRQAAEIWKDLGEPEPIERARALNTAGRANARLGRWEEARGQFEEALALARALRHLEWQANILSNLGKLLADNGDPQAGIGFLAESLQLARESGSEAGQPSTLLNLGSASMDLAERQTALQSYHQALELARKMGRKDLQATAFNNLGDLYEALGDWERALEHHNQALALNREIGKRPWEEAATLNNLGMVYRQMEDPVQARASLEDALSLAQKIGDARLQARFLTNLALIDLWQGKAAEARDRCRQALLLAGGSKAVEVQVRHALGAAYLDLGDVTLARDELRQALALSRERDDQSREAEISRTLARAERAAGNLPEALSLIQGAVEIIETLRTRVVSQELRTSFFASKQAFYELYVEILMELHRARPEAGFAADALQVSERARARSLLEILAEAQTDIRQGADPVLVEREHWWRTEVSARELHRLELLSGEASSERRAEAEAKRREALEEYHKVQADLRASSPRYAALTQPQPLDVREIQTEVLDGEALLLEYALGKEKSYLWAVTPNSLHSFELPPRDQLEAVARRWYDLLTTRNQTVRGETIEQTRKRHESADAEAAKTAAQLSGMLLGPAAHLVGARSILVVADGALQYIPFAALPAPGGGGLLVDRSTVVSLPSASALAVLRQDIAGRKTAARTLAVLADPVFQKDDRRLLQRLGRSGPLRLAKDSSSHRGTSLQPGQDLDLADFRRLLHSEREANAIASLVKADQPFKALSFDASRATALSGELRHYRNVHFATHGLLKSDHPELSGLVLSLFNERGEPQDGFLRLNDIYNLELNADLVVLSACRTALGKEVRGEGLVGLTRGFMYAGSARVLATLWSVQDRATADLMKRFYSAMLTSGQPPAAALRQAQLEMARDPRWKSPYFWAGFSLQGEWR